MQLHIVPSRSACSAAQSSCFPMKIYPGVCAVQRTAVTARASNRPIMESELSALLQRYGVSTAITDIGIFHEALTHPTHKRMAYLGDSVIELVVSEEAFFAHRQAQEGDLSLERECLVNGSALASLATHIGLPDYIQATPYVKQQSHIKLRADAFEAFVAAVFLNAIGSGHDRLTDASNFLLAVLRSASKQV